MAQTNVAIQRSGWSTWGVVWLVVARGWANGPPCEVLKKTFYQLDLSLTPLSLKTELSKCHVKIHVCVCFKKRFPNGLCLSAIVTKLVAICKKTPITTSNSSLSMCMVTNLAIEKHHLS